MLADPSINNTNIKLPLVMAPSNLSTASCLDYVLYYRNNHPNAWAQIDIVALHQYGEGYNGAIINAIRNLLDGRQFYQSEMYADYSDNLNIGNAIERPHRTSLDLSGLFNTAMNNGVEAWFYFENNYPQVFHPGGLIRVAWGGTPTPYKHFYSFKQITSRQPSNTHVLNQRLTGFNKSEVTSFRKKDGDSIYVNISNFESTSKQVTINIEGASNNKYGIKSAEEMF